LLLDTLLLDWHLIEDSTTLRWRPHLWGLSWHVSDSYSRLVGLSRDIKRWSTPIRSTRSKPPSPASRLAHSSRRVGAVLP